MEFKGIDVSKWQYNIDWKKVKDSGVQFAILRAGYGKVISQRDKTFETNYEGCKDVGLPVGAYWYSYATDVEGAHKEAKTFLEAIKGKSFEYPVYFDQEYEESIKALTNQERTDIVKAFCQDMEAAGYYTGLYCSLDWLQNWVHADQLKQYDVWVAAYVKKVENAPIPYGIWQYSSKGEVPGISVDVDLDISYKDYPSIMKKARLNNVK